MSDTWLVSVDVQGGLSGDAALEVAEDLASQQANCLETGGPCQDLTGPEALEGASEATPEG